MNLNYAERGFDEEDDAPRDFPRRDYAASRGFPRNMYYGPRGFAEEDYTPRGFTEEDELMEDERYDYDREFSSEDELSSETVPYVRNRTALGDQKHNYTILEIFESLNIEDTIKIADMNYVLQQIVTKHFLLRKFRLHERVVSIGEPTKPLYKSDSKIEEWGDTIAVVDPVYALKFLRNYGHLITRLEVRQPARDSNKVWNYILQLYVNEYGCEHLKELQVHTHFDTIEWKKPFQQLETLRILKGWLEYVNTTNFDGMFPVLRNLELTATKKPVLNLFALQFPNLENFTFELHPDNENSTAFYEKFLDLNPQIKNVVFYGAQNFKDLKSLSEKLHSLETLDVSVKPACSDNEIASIQFKNVKQCKFTLLRSTQFIPMMFDQLEHLQFNFNNVTDDAVMKFLSQQQNLKVLELSTEPLKLNQWSTLLENMPHLTKLVVKRWDPATTKDTLSALMKQSNLNKIVMNGLYGMSSDFAASWEESLDWQMESKTEYNTVISITFTRK